jgi:preprotein translocase subunit YajC
MLAWFATIPLLFAQAAAKGGGAARGGDDSGLSTILPLVLIPVLFYFVMLRPQQQQERKRKDMLGTLKKNDRVLTSAGMYGTVVSIDTDQDRVVLRVDDDKGTRIAFTRASIVRVLDGAQDKEKEKTKAAETA